MNNTVRLEWLTGEVEFVSRPLCWIEGFPPLDGETTVQYQRRVYPLLWAAVTDQRPKWWQFWK